MGLPKSLTLPSGRVVGLRSDGTAATARAEGTPLFAEVLALLDEGHVTLREGGRDLDPRGLALSDFHVLRAVLIHAELVPEDAVDLSCHNCDHALTVRPCAQLEIGPWVHGEASDPELDATLPTGTPIPIPLVRLAGGRARRGHGRRRASPRARDVTFAARTVGDALPLFRALGRGALDLSAESVDAMGISALGAEHDPERISRALATCSNAAWDATARAFLDTHYPLRLGAAAFCDACGARNDVDAPYEREFELPPQDPPGASDGDALPPFDAFADLAHELAAPLVARFSPAPLVVVEGGVPAVDDGGEPLLGSYDPASPGSATEPSRPATITIYHRSFHALADAGDDWRAEVKETIAHELEHHENALRGDDPLDDAERDEIADEAIRLVGPTAAKRRAAIALGDSLRDFAHRTWPIWVLVVIAAALTLLADR